jgi:F-type H+-transporting ATPase subunit epsilon
MADGLKLEIVSPERLVLSQEVRAVTVPGTEGYLTVVGEHAPLMTTLKPGFVTVVSLAGESQNYYVRGGFADISPEGLTILADEAASFAEFNREAIEIALGEAQQQLAQAETPEQRSWAQSIVSGWMNLMLEAEHLEQTHIH